MKRILLYGLLIMFTLPMFAKIQQSIARPDTLRLGSNIYLTLTAPADLADVVKPDTMSNFAILKVDKLAEKGKPTALKLTIVALDTGEQTFPALVVKAAKPTADSLVSQAFTVKIQESRSPKDSTLVDIAGTQKLKGELPWWVYYLIGGLLVGAILAGLLYLLLKKKKPKALEKTEQATPQNMRSAWQKAMDALKDLQAQKLPEQGAFITFHYRLSEILKLWLEAELGFSANEMTTREIRKYFKLKTAQIIKDNSGITFEQDQHPALQTGQQAQPSSLRLTHAEENIFINWLESCDRVKFAKYEPTVTESNAKLDEIITWLQKYGENVPTGSESYATKGTAGAESQKNNVSAGSESYATKGAAGSESHPTDNDKSEQPDA